MEKSSLVIAYRVQHDSADRINTIRAQQEFRYLLYNEHRQAKNTRKAFDTDFKNYIRNIQQKGYPVLVFLDANLGHDDKDNKELSDDTGLMNVLLAKHTNETPLRTYNRGEKASDLSLCCQQALRLIKVVGILEFYQILPTDHRSLYIDFFENLLMTPAQDKTELAFNVPSL